MKIEVIDNFLNDDVFIKLNSLVLRNIGPNEIDIYHNQIIKSYQ